MTHTPSPPRPPRPTRLGRLVIGPLLALLLVATLVTPAVADDADARVVVRTESPRDLDRLLDRYDLVVGELLVPSRNLYSLGPASPGVDAKDVEKLAKEIAKEPGVVWAELDGEDQDPEDTRFHAWPKGDPIRTGDDPSTWMDQPALASLQLDAVHRRATGEGVVVAVLDTGADLTHPQLRAHLGAGHYDYVDDDPHPAEEGNGRDDDGDGHVDEAYGHGTHAAGLVARIAPDAEILVYRVLDADGRGHPHVIAQAIEDAVAAGADVINVSFGMTVKPKSKVVRYAFKRARKAGVVVVAAAGNDGEKMGQYPAEDNEVLGVAALGAGNDTLAWFSNHGKPALVAAPGEGVVSTVPGGGFGAWSGTSMATPIVAGQVALVRGEHPDLKAKKVVELVGKSAVKLEGKRKSEKGRIDILRSIDG